jgi:serine/threonine-protein kinase RsbW
MTVPTHRFDRRAPALPSTVTELRHALTQYAVHVGAAEALLPSVQLAVSEAVSNVVVHAYSDRSEPGPVVAQAWVEAPHLVIRVCDEGHGMKPRLDTPGLGMGLPLITSMADDLEIVARADRPGVTLTMRFVLDGTGASAVPV